MRTSILYPKRSAKISLIKHYLIGCAHLLFVKFDTRTIKYGHQTYALRQADITALYFDNIDRTYLSPSKRKYPFIAPDWYLLQLYLFPWIRFNMTNSSVNLTEIHIRHAAFRIWEYLVIEDRVVICHANKEHDILLGKARGWWLDVDGYFPPSYEGWNCQYDGYLPGKCIIWHR